MIGWLSDLVNNFVCWVETAIAFIVNGVVAALGVIATAALALLPSMPSVPDVPADVTAALGAANYYLPVTFTLTLLGTVITIELTIFVVKIALRWGRVVP